MAQTKLHQTTVNNLRSRLFARPLFGALFLSGALLALAGCGGGGGNSSSSGGNGYSITDLGTLPGDTSSFAQGINAGGQVVGASETTTGLRVRSLANRRQ